MSVVTLRDPIESDFEPIFAMTQDPVANAMSMVYPRTRAQFREQWSTRSDHPACLLRTILCDGEVVGRVNSFPNGDETHVGYLVARSHWGRGVMSAALRLFLEELTHRPLMAHVASPNIGSRRVLEKCGFVKIDERESPETERYMACIEVVYELR